LYFVRVIVIVFALLKWLKSEFIAYDERHKKRVARSSVDMDGRCPARSVNSVRIVLSALVQKKARLSRLTADWHK